MSGIRDAREAFQRGLGECASVTSLTMTYGAGNCQVFSYVCVCNDKKGTVRKGTYELKPGVGPVQAFAEYGAKCAKEWGDEKQ